MNFVKPVLAVLVAAAVIAGAAALIVVLLTWPSQTAKTARLRLPSDVGPILVVVDPLPGKDAFVTARAEQVALGLRYLTPRTSSISIDRLTARDASAASAVVYLGLNGLRKLAPSELFALGAARRLIVSEHHLAELRKAGIAFAHVTGGRSMRAPVGTTVEYRGVTSPVDFAEFLDIRAADGARVLGAYNTGVPYLAIDGSALFVNGPISFTMQGGHGAMLAACDAIAAFLGVHPNAQRLAMLRLEDVSGLTSAQNMWLIALYLSRAHVPYGIGVVPDLFVKNGRRYPLKENARLVAALRFAQAHGATIILHGLHHCCSSTDAEGFEFWDHDRNAAPASDSASWMRAQIAEGLASERAVGLEPTMWETPHYAASQTDYRVIHESFPVAWELRDPLGWMPWPLQRDRYDSLLLPENLGYVSLDGSNTVEDQLARARAMLACRYCVAAGFLHPALVRVAIVKAYVNGLSKLGYSFVDPAQFTRSGR